MVYDNLSRQELINLLKKRNENFDALNEKVIKIEKEINLYKIPEMKKLMEDIKNQKRVYTELISSLRQYRAEYMQINKLYAQANELYKDKIEN